MKELAVFLDNSLKVPIYEQIYIYIRDEILAFHIKAGTRLPSSRALSSYLQISRSTVLMAYDQLIAEGYIESITKKGYYVLETEKSFEMDGENELKDKLEPEKNEKYTMIFSPDGIEASYFPTLEWKRITRSVFDSESKEIFNSGDPRGDVGLRRLLAKYLRESRGVKANPENIILGAGNETLLMILSILLKDSTYAMEDPTYKKSYHILKDLGSKVVPVPMDQNGMDIKALVDSKAEVAYVTPSHQYPLGIVMSIRRRMELLTWAQKQEERYIIEDDYDSEFRYKGKPIPSLQGKDIYGKVIYMGTFSKSISPAVRIAYMVLPDDLYVRYQKRLFYCNNTVSRLDQKLVELFIESGGYDKHLNRMRTIYKNKHDSMLLELRAWENIEIFGENAGAHMLIQINNGMSEIELIKKAKQAHIKVYGLSDYYITQYNEKVPVIILGYAKLNVEKIIEGLKILKKVWNIEG